MRTVMDVWRRTVSAPAVMVGSFAIAVVMAVAHHAFYWTLHGQAVSSATFNQQTNLAGGTAFAFLVRAFLVISVGTAYVQALWYTLLRHQLSVATIDTLSSLLISGFQIFSLHLTWRHPILVALAIVSWLVPFSTVVPPATLSVHSVVTTNHTMQNVTALDWQNKHIYLSDVVIEENNILTGGPIWFIPPVLGSRILSRIVALQNYLPLIPTITTNSSYRLEFPAPALHCQAIDPDILGNWSQKCPSDGSFYAPYGQNWAGYLAWIPSLLSFDGTLIEPIPQHSNGTLQCNDFRKFTGAGSYSWHDEAPEMFVAVKVGLYSPGHWNGTDLGPGPWSLTKCQFMNATYTVDFHSSNGRQKLEVVDKRLEPLQSISSYGARHDAPATILHNTPAAIFNYLTMIGIFGQMTAGAISLFDLLEGSYNRVPDIFSTAVATSDEAIAFYKAGYGFLAPSMKEDDLALVSTGPITTALEDVFQNITLALFSSPMMAASTGRANVSQWMPTNVYQYSWSALVMSYGIGIFAGAIVVVLGCYTAYLNDGPYRNRYSTFLRTTAWRDLDGILLRDDNGAGPIPREIAEATVTLGRSTVNYLPESELVRRTQPAHYSVEFSKAAG